MLKVSLQFTMKSRKEQILATIEMTGQCVAWLWKNSIKSMLNMDMTVLVINTKGKAQFLCSIAPSGEDADKPFKNSEAKIQSFTSFKDVLDVNLKKQYYVRKIDQQYERVILK